MKPTLLIAFRFFVESKRAMIMSSLGVVFGVGFFIVGQAQTEGFQTYFIQTILGSKGALLVSDRFQETYSDILQKDGKSVVAVSNPQARKYYPGINEAFRIMRIIRTFPNVSSCASIVEKNVFIRSGFRSEPCIMQGIILEDHMEATDFVSQINSGFIEDFRDNPDAVAIGIQLRDKLEVRLGQNVYLTTGPDKEPRKFKVTNTFETGINYIDEKRIYVHRRAAQTAIQDPFLTSYILVQLHNPERAAQDAKAIMDLIHHNTRTWQEREKGNLQIFAAIRISAAVGVSCIILLAGFGIFNILTMSVLDKIKEIAILRSMGYTAQDISSIFVYQGLCIAFVGITLGCGLGAVLTWSVSKIPLKIRGIFKADHFMVQWELEHYILAATLGLASVFIASYIPAIRAARIKPVDILRGSSS